MASSSPPTHNEPVAVAEALRVAVALLELVDVLVAERVLADVLVLVAVAEAAGGGNK